MKVTFESTFENLCHLDHGPVLERVPVLAHLVFRGEGRLRAHKSISHTRTHAAHVILAHTLVLALSLMSVDAEPGHTGDALDPPVCSFVPKHLSLFRARARSLARSLACSLARSLQSSVGQGKTMVA
jgi:hypothetical protein